MDGLVRIKAGTFMMGEPLDKDNQDPYQQWMNPECPSHQVTISRDFFMGRTVVTIKEWKRLIWEHSLIHHLVGLDESSAVFVVDWYSALLYCNKLSVDEGLDPAYQICMDSWKGAHFVKWKGLDCKGYRLPTEAEWEYACRAGSTTRFASGDSEESLRCIARYNLTTHKHGTYVIPVASKAPNVWGLHDMHGSVYEWCWDHYDYYSSTEKDPTTAEAHVAGLGDNRVVRGGARYSPAKECRSASRARFPADTQSSGIGFRVVRTA